jgi:predicted dehydrogenase
MPKSLRFAVFGAGFWAPYQLSGWREVGGVECVAIYNRTPKKAEAIARRFGIPAVFDDPARLLKDVRPDFVDNITEVGGHKPLSLLCARRRVPCICQKPLAASYRDAAAIVGAFGRTKTRFFVHENWRWQTPMRQLRKLLDAGAIGVPLRARLTAVSGFDVFANQPALRELDRFILTDLGTHLLDVARVLFGEARTLYCRAARTLAPRVKGENIATVLLTMGRAETHVTVELGYARTPLEASAREVFPQTLAFVEGTRGSIELAADYVVRLTTTKGTQVTRHAPPRYAWADPRYEVAQAGTVSCCADLLSGLRGEGGGETTGEDNLKTLRLVFAAYDSARTGRAVTF